MRYVYGMTLLAMLVTALYMQFLSSAHAVDVVRCVLVGCACFAVLRPVEGWRRQRAIRARRAALRRAHSLPVQ